jgi:hypothetical protein
LADALRAFVKTWDSERAFARWIGMDYASLRNLLKARTKPLKTTLQPLLKIRMSLPAELREKLMQVAEYEKHAIERLSADLKKMPHQSG